MSTSLLNLNQTPEELNNLYADADYYWYLRSPQFQEAFLLPLAQLVNHYGKSCLDVGCGEGQLYDHTTVAYTGMDGSLNALIRGKAARPNANLIVGRMEEPQASVTGTFEVVVFGGILEVLIKPEQRIPMLEMYQQLYKPEYFIVYDLERLDTKPIEQRYKLIEVLHRHASGIVIEEAKLHRKIMVFKCN